MRILYEYLNHEYWLFFFFFLKNVIVWIDWIDWLNWLNWLNWIELNWIDCLNWLLELLIYLFIYSFNDSNEYYFTKSLTLTSLLFISLSLSASLSSSFQREHRRSDKWSAHHDDSFTGTHECSHSPSTESNQFKSIQLQLLISCLLPLPSPVCPPYSSSHKNPTNTKPHLKISISQPKPP